ncbi:hypothetical protein PAMA_011877 [Pampus argenteus]
MFVPLPVPFVFQRTASDFSAWRLKSSLAPRSSPAPFAPCFLSGGGGAGVRAPRVILSPLLISFVFSSVRERSVRDPEMLGVDLYP